MKKLCCIVGLSVVLAACSSTPADQAAAPVDDRNPLASTAGAGSATSPAGGGALGGSAIAPGGRRFWLATARGRIFLTA